MVRLSASSLVLVFAASILLPNPIPAQQPSTQNLPYMNPSLPVEHRVDDLVSRLTLVEKIQQMHNHAPAISRLGIPAYDYANEGLHGVAFGGYATNFPQVIGMAATWDSPLVHRMGEVISTEARAKYNQALREDDHEAYFGLTFWAPNINIFRDPRWGRGQETYGEDPFLTARMAVAYVTGMQGDDPNYLRTISTPKHYDVHSGPESTRHSANVDVSTHDLEDTYTPAFRAAITEAHAQSVMCAYNSIDGAPACANAMLLRDHLRDAWHFDGYVVSDCGALADISNGHRYAPDKAHAAADAVKAGTDLECGGGANQVFPELLDAVHQNLITEADLDIALRRLFRARFKLGMFDPPSAVAFNRIPFTEVNSPQHRQLALQAARESIVLLKNNNRILPLSPHLHSIAVIGPTADLLQSLQGNYNGTPVAPVYPLAGVEKRFASARINYAQGSTLVEGLSVPIEETALSTESATGKSRTFGLTAEYFSSPDLTGQPVLTRIDRIINFNWQKAIPFAGMQRDNWSVRWSGAFTPPAPGVYKLGARITCRDCRKDEAFRLFLDNKLLVQSTDQADQHAGAFEIPVTFADTKSHAIRLEYLHGNRSAGIDLTWEPPSSALRDEAVTAAKQSDVTIAFVGLSPSLEGEEMPVHLDGFSGGDRTSIDLPAVQQDLLKAVAATGKPLIVVLQNGSALAVNWAQQHANAILEAWYPGESGGTAIAETLAGDNNPAGRLPLTFYASLSQLPPFEDYAMQNRTYRYFTGQPLYTFGYGLSYTTFSYRDLRLPSTIQAGDPITVEAELKNTGSLGGDEVAELYLTQPRGYQTPVRKLVGFQRVHLEPGRSTRLSLTVDPRSLSQVDAQGNHVILPGDYTLSLGSTQPSASTPTLTGHFTITGQSELPE